MPEPNSKPTPHSKTTQRTAVSYIDRTREYYAAQGYDRPYAWARHLDAPFARLEKPLSECRVAVVTTASPWTAGLPADGVPRSGQRVWSGPTAEPPEKLYTGDRAWDREATHTDDVESFLPLASLKAHAEAGRIAGLAQRFHGVPTDYSQRNTLEKDAPEILERCREDSADIALLVPL